MKVELKFDSTWQEFEAYQDAIITDVLHKGLAPADNEARVTFYQSIALYNLLRGMTSSQKVPARILDDSSNPIFYGFVDRSFSVKKGQRLKPIEVQLVSPTNYLKAKIVTTLAYTNIPISAASAATPSLVRHVLHEAGYLDADIVIPDIAALIPAVVIEEKTTTYFDVIKDALFEGGYILDFDETGKTKYYDLFPATVASTFTLDGTTNTGEVVQTIEKEEQEAVHITYPETKTVTGALIFKDTTNPVGLYDCNVEIQPEEYLNGEEFWYAEYACEEGDILAASGAALDIIKDSHVQVLEFSPLAKRAKLSIYNSSPSVVGIIRRLRITGDAVIQTGVNVIKRTDDSTSEKIYEYETKYLYVKSAVESLANKLMSYFRVSDFTYKVNSKTKLAIGAVGTITEYGIGSNLCRVIERKANLKTGGYEYTLEAIADYVAPVIAESEKYIWQMPAAQKQLDEHTAEIEAAQLAATAATTSLAPAAIAQYNPAYTPELPDDPAGVAYQPTFATTDSWTGLTNNTVSVSDNRLISTLSATGQLAAYRAISFSGGKMWVFYFEEQYGDSYRFRAVVGGVSTVIADVAFTANTRQLVSIYIPTGTITEIRFANLTSTTRAAGSTAKLDTLYIGTGACLPQTLDTSGNGNHLTNTAAVPVDYNGRKWWAFNGASSNLVATTAILGATGFFSRRIMTPATFTEQFICGNLSGNTGCALKIMSGGILRLAVGNGSTVVNLDTTVAASTEYWIGCYIGATSATLYKDGAVADTDTVTMSASSTAWVEGKNPASAANYWAGYTASPYATTILPTISQIRDLYVNGLPAELYTPAMYRDDIIDDDGQISVEEKIPLKTRVLEIYNLENVTTALSTTSTTKDGDFSAITAEAIAAGLTAASAEVVLYVGAANAIRDFCWNSSTGVLNNMAAPSTVTAGAIDELLAEYRTAYNGLRQAILNQRVTSSSTLDPIQANGYHQLPVDSGGTPTTYVGSGNLIQVFEGVTHLQATTGTPGNGQFKVVATGTNITAGAVSVSGLDAAIADASSITADAAYITFAITGKSSAGTAFSIYLSQTITKSRAGADAVVYSIATSVGTAKVNSAGAVSPSTVSATRYKKVGSASKAVTTDGTLKYKRSSDAGETATTNGTGISIAATDTYIDFFFYDASAVLDVTVRVPIIVDGLIADVATYAPRYLGVGLLAADDSATFRLDSVDSAGDITTGSNTTAHVGDSMVNHDATNVALGIYVWSGTEWVITQDMARLSEVQTSIFALAQGGITIPGLAVVQTLMAQRLFAIETTIADTGWVKSANYAETGGYPTAGFMLDSTNELIKAKGARFVDAEVSGTLIGGGRYDRTGTVIDQKEPGIFIKAGEKGLIGGFDFTSPYGNPVKWNPGWKNPGASALSLSSGDSAPNALTATTDLSGQSYIIHFSGNGWLDLYKYSWPNFTAITSLNVGSTTKPAVAAYDEGRVAVYDADAGTVRTYSFDESGFTLLKTNTNMGVSNHPTNIVAISAGKIAWSHTFTLGYNKGIQYFIGDIASDGTITATSVYSTEFAWTTSQSAEMLALSAGTLIVAAQDYDRWTVTAYSVSGTTLTEMGSWIIFAPVNSRLKMVALGGCSFIIHCQLTGVTGYKALVVNVSRGAFSLDHIEDDDTGGGQYGYPSIRIAGTQIANSKDGIVHIKEKTFGISGVWQPGWDTGL